MKYFNAIKVNDLIYSVDMIRFKFEISEFYQKELYDIIKQIGSYDYFNSHKAFAYRELFKIRTSNAEFSYSLGLGFNGLKRSDRNLCFIEFNPNKLYNCIELVRVLRFLNNRNINLDLATYDIAIDIPYSKKYVSLIKDKRIYKKFCYDCEGKNTTEYLGVNADAGRAKLYNKTIESNLNYDLTRLELTTSCTDYVTVEKQLPNLLVCGDLDLLVQTKLSKSDYVLLQLLWQCDDPSYYFKQLGRDKQEKLKPFISSNFSLNFSEKIFDQLFNIINTFKDKNYEIPKEDIQESLFC